MPSEAAKSSTKYVKNGMTMPKPIMSIMVTKNNTNSALLPAVTVVSEVFTSDITIPNSHGFCNQRERGLNLIDSSRWRLLRDFRCKPINHIAKSLY